MSNKFSIGDKVVATGNYTPERLRGREGVVVSRAYSEVDANYVNFGDNDVGHFSFDNELDLIEPKKDKKMASEFVSTITTKQINTIRNGKLPNLALITVEPVGSTGLELTIGAEAKDGCANHFSKEDLDELIAVLQDVSSCLR